MVVAHVAGFGDTNTGAFEALGICFIIYIEYMLYGARVQSSAYIYIYIHTLYIYTQAQTEHVH